MYGPGYYIRNKETGAFICQDNLQPREFMSRPEAREYIKARDLNPHIYQIGFFSVRTLEFITL